jgi:hypothetical protein
MKISQLPQEVKEKALEYQRNASNLFNKDTDGLEYAFDWSITKEECDYWHEWFNSSSPKKIMYSEVNRVEVIQHSPPFNGRAYTHYNAREVEIQLQDNGNTLKIFLK